MSKIYTSADQLIGHTHISTLRLDFDFIEFFVDLQNLLFGEFCTNHTENAAEGEALAHFYKRLINHLHAEIHTDNRLVAAL